MQQQQQSVLLRCSVEFFFFCRSVKSCFFGGESLVTASIQGVYDSCPHCFSLFCSAIPFQYSTMTSVSRTHFRPCIDLHSGQVKQIVGGSLNEKDESQLKTNFVSRYRRFCIN